MSEVRRASGRLFDAVCPVVGCRAVLLADMARGGRRVSEDVWEADFECGSCGLSVVVDLSLYGFARLVADRKWLEDHPGEDVRLAKSEWVGREVQGWRVELDVVVDVGDLLLHWDYQERVSPGSVAREALV